jgi:ParB family chromosome partitioning protein
MTSDVKKRGLGRGLDALFQDARNEEASFAPKIRRADEIVSKAFIPSPLSAPALSAPQKISIEKLKPGKFQPRRHFTEAAINDLAESIAVHGVIQPLLVRKLSANDYEIIAGERRWRAAQKAQVHELPVIVLDLSDNDALEIALIENLQREDLSALEEAEGYQRLMDEFHHTQDVLAHRLGKSRSHVANMLRLLKLPAKVKQYMQDGALSAGHARALIGCTNAEEIAHAIVKRGLSVRQTEKLVQNAGAGKIKIKKQKKAGAKGFALKDVDVLALEEKISSLLGMKVTIESAGAEGSLSIEYRSLEQLDDLLERLSQTPGKK